MAGLSLKRVAVSSDATLPTPRSNSAANLEEVLSGLTLQTEFAPADLELTELSQLLWAGYGCIPHWTSNSRGALTAPSWVAEYFLTGRIYVVQEKVRRFCNRRSADRATRDHRLELVQEADVRAEVRRLTSGCRRPLATFCCASTSPASGPGTAGSRPGSWPAGC